jgi:hypothetical protein
MRTVGDAWRFVCNRPIQATALAQKAKAPISHRDLIAEPSLAQSNKKSADQLLLP